MVDTICVVYLDDILIYSRSEADHEMHVKQVLQRLRDWNLYAKVSKCTFNTYSVDYLRYVITPKGVVIDEDRIKTILEWPDPRSFHDIQVFVGFSNFYRRFIYMYSDICRPLNDLVKNA